MNFSQSEEIVGCMQGAVLCFVVGLLPLAIGAPFWDSVYFFVLCCCPAIGIVGAYVLFGRMGTNVKTPDKEATAPTTQTEETQ